MYITDQQIEKAVKIFFRFLKERKKYSQIKRYLFYEGRDKDEFFESVRQLYEEQHSFGDILHVAYTLGPENDWEYRGGVDYWYDVHSMSSSWWEYWRYGQYDEKVFLINNN